MVLRSAWAPAPALLSEPAIERITAGAGILVFAEESMFKDVGRVIWVKASSSHLCQLNL